MKKNTLGMKKPAFLVMGGTLALLSWTTPSMAQEMKAPTQVFDTLDGKAGHSDKVTTAEYINARDSKSGKDSENKDNSDKDMKDKNKSDNDIKAKGDGNNQLTGEQKSGNNNNSEASKPFVTDITNATQGGKQKISFTVPDGEQDIDMEFTVYQIKGNERVVFSKNKGKYNQGKHTIDLNMPEGSDKYDLEVSCKRANDNRTTLWSRASLDNTWKNVEIKADDKNEVPVTSRAVISDVKNISAAGKAKISFQVQKQQQGPVELDLICYKTTGSGRAVQSKISGKFEEGQHTVDLDLPQGSDNYNLEISARASDNYSAVLWSRAAQGEWKAAYGNSVGLAAVLLQKLLITSITVDATGTTKAWKVENPSTESVTFTWKIEGTDQSGSQTVAAGQSATITANQGGNQNLLVSVVGERGYNVSIQPTVSSANFNSSSGGAATPITPNTSSTASATNPSGGTSRTGNPSISDSTPSSTGGSSASGTAPIAGTTSTATPVADTASNTAPPDSAATTTAVSDASMSANDLNQPSGVQLAQLPQTGENAPYGFYGAGALLALIGSLILRKRKNNV